MSERPLHPSLGALARLVGEWAGPGAGSYPTIEPFGYHEAVTFGHVGKPFLAYRQRTRASDDGRPLHAETGYWRPAADALEVVIAHPTGVAEIYEGSLGGDPDGVLHIDLRTTAVLLTPTAKLVESVTRSFVLDGDVLRYELAMAAVGQQMTHHLSAQLRRVAG